MKKIIITLMALATMVSLVSCGDEPVQPELSPEGAENIETENIITEHIEIEGIDIEYTFELGEIEYAQLEEDHNNGLVSDEYYEEYLYNSGR